MLESAAIFVYNYIVTNYSLTSLLYNYAGQKLKVQIPAKADMEKRTFVASVPGPKVPFTKKENNLPKEFKEALCKCLNCLWQKLVPCTSALI